MDGEERVVGVSDFLLELRSEEIPARMQAKAREDLARLFAGELAKAGIASGAVETFSTPRRLVLIARDLPDATEAVSEEVKGPRANAPEQALEGFLRKTGLTRADLTERDGVLFAVSEKPGRATAEVLAEAIPAIIRAFPWPKSMRWGDASASTESARWVRPLQGIVAIFGEEVVACAAAGVTSGAATVGHRFHHPGVITIGGAHDYVEKLRACHVIVDQAERAGDNRREARQGGRGGGADVGRGRGAGGGECGADRMAGAVAGPLRRGVPGRAARGDPADRAGEPEVFRLFGCGREARQRVRLHRQYRRERRRGEDRRGQPQGAGGAAGGCAVLL